MKNKNRPFESNFKLKNKKIMKNFKSIAIGLVLILLVGFVVYSISGPNSKVWNAASDSTIIKVDTLVVDSVAVDTIHVDSVE